jgi:predicted permease
MLRFIWECYFLAYPFISQVLGSRGLLYAIIFSVSNELLLWSVGIYLLIRESQENRAKWQIKYLLNPNTIAFFVGMILFVFGIHLPDLIHAPLERLGSATVPLAMLFIGSTLAAIKLKYAIKNVSVWSIVIVKMVAMPLLFILVMLLIGLDKLSSYQIMLSVIVLQIAMPTQTNLAVLADRYKADSTYAAQAIFVTTIVSVMSLPIFDIICKKLFGIL